MGKKYIIELCEKPMKNENGNDIWRVKGFNTLVFDQNGLDKLEEYKEPAGHKFEVGDVCWMPDIHGGSKVLVLSIGDFIIVCMNVADGGVHSTSKKLFEEKAAFLHRSETFKNFLKGDFT